MSVLGNLQTIGAATAFVLLAGTLPSSADHCGPETDSFVQMRKSALAEFDAAGNDKARYCAAARKVLQAHEGLFGLPDHCNHRGTAAQVKANLANDITRLRAVISNECGRSAAGADRDQRAACGVSLGAPVSTRCMGSNEWCTCLNVHNSCPYKMSIKYRLSGFNAPLSFDLDANSTDTASACTTRSPSQTVTYVGAEPLRY